ncbi:MAG TPA: translation initiation factor IF-3 [Tissierellia bacterium]|nr:translation initiation factor IF-3 [Tissierellia bacterium]
MGVKGIKRTEINEEIRDREVRLIGPNGDQLGIMSASQALDRAVSTKLDLVKIAPNAKPPVVKIMDYGKFRYEQTKAEKEQRKKQKVIQVKEIRLSVTIDEHDIQTKARHAIKFLEDGDRLKVSLRYRGRQLGRKEQGLEVVERFSDIIKDYGSLDRPPKYEGRSLIAFYSPKKK